MTDFQKAIKETVKGQNEMRGMNLFPRAVPLTFAYMRVAPENPHAATYRQMLQAQNPTQFYEDVPAGIGVRPQFDAMLAELRPHDTVILIRLDHLSASSQRRLGLVHTLAEAQVHIKLISNAATQSTPTAALTLDILVAIGGLNLEWLMEGSDGGCGNGGP